MKIRRKQDGGLSVTEGELVTMTEELDQLHHDKAMPAMRSSLAEWREGLSAGVRRPTSRRLFLLGAGGALAGAGVVAASSAVPGLAGAASSASGSTPEAGLTGTLKVAALAASLENLAVYTYGAAIAAAGAGKLGTVPPAIATFATTVKAQHTQHAAAWNSLLTATGKKKVTVTDPSLTPMVRQQLGSVTNVTQLGQLALQLENGAAQTYQVEASKLKSKKAVSVAATIQPVEMQHAAILYYVLGMYPGIQDSAGTPLAFNPTTMAA